MDRRNYPKEGVRVSACPQGLGIFSLRLFRVRDLIGPIEGTIVEDPLYESEYCMELGPESVLEPAAPFRYVNHSCHPNCDLVEVHVDDADGQGATPRLWLEAQVDIPPGEQITIDYRWPARSAIPCRCGCPDCRGWIVDGEEVDQVRQRASGNSA